MPAANTSSGETAQTVTLPLRASPEIRPDMTADHMLYKLNQLMTELRQRENGTPAHPSRYSADWTRVELANQVCALATAFAVEMNAAHPVEEKKGR